MRRSTFIKTGFIIALAPLLGACEPEHYVSNNGTNYYDANYDSTDYTPTVPYTKDGQYISNPDETTNTRDNRGMRPQGYGHDASTDYYQPPAGTVVVAQPTPGGGSRVVYPPYPPGSALNADGSVTFPNGSVVYPQPVSTTTTTTTVIRSQ